jgi:hypothetical protein
MRAVLWSFVALPILSGAACGDSKNMDVGVAADGSDGAAAPDGSVPADAALESDVRAEAPDASSEAGVEGGCVPGATASCYSGPAGTAGVGTCVAGVETCGSGGTWGPCIGEVDPTPDVCGGPDSNCDGKLPPQQCPGDVVLKYPKRPGQDAGGQAIAVDPTTGHVILVGDFELSVDFGLGPLTGASGVGTGFMLTLDSTLTPIAQTSFGSINGIDLHADPSGNRLIHLSAYGASVANLGGGPITGGVQALGLIDQTGKTLLWQKTRADPLPAVWTENVGAAFNQRAIMWVAGNVPDYGCAKEVDGSTPQTVLVELGPGPTCEWETNITTAVGVLSMAARSDGSTAVLGYYNGQQSVALGATNFQQGSPKMVLFVVDPNGVVEWADALDPSLPVIPGFVGALENTLLAVGPSDEIYIAGDCGAASLDLGGGPMPLQSTSPGGDDIVVARFDSNGKYVWAKRIAGDAVGARVSWLGAGPTAIFVSGGTQEGHVNFGGGLLSPAFIASLDLNGNYRWGVSEYTDSVASGAVAGTSFVYTVTSAGNLWQFLY